MDLGSVDQNLTSEVSILYSLGNFESRTVSFLILELKSILEVVSQSPKKGSRSDSFQITSKKRI